MRKLFFVLALCFSLNISIGQTIESRLFVDILPQGKTEWFLDDQETEEVLCFYRNPIVIEQILSIEDWISDSITLTLRNLSPWGPLLNKFLYQNLEVLSKSLSLSDYKTIEYHFDGQNLTFPTTDSSTNIKIRYQYQSDYAIRTRNLSHYFFNPIISGWQSWYFIHSDMCISSINYSYPEKEIYLFTETDYSQVLGDAGVSFYILSQDFYNMESFRIENTELNLLYTKGVIVDTVKVLLDNNEKLKGRIYPQNENVNRRRSTFYSKERLAETIFELRNIFSNRDSLSITIADSYQSEEDENGKVYTWGVYSKYNDVSHNIIVDTSFWHDYSLLHEIIHVFNKYHPRKSDSAFYFLNESIVEYLAVSLYYDTAEEREKVFENKLDKYVSSLSSADSSTNGLSIFTVVNNEALLDGSGGGSANIIYNKTPYDIHQFATMIGEENFISLLSEFYDSITSNEECNFSHFTEVMTSSDFVLKEQWELFITNLNH